jgi:uncharacterized protein YbjT (DUF2867 family)
MNRRFPAIASPNRPMVVLGGTGKTGRRVVERLTARGLPLRIGSRSGEPRFDWEDRSTWDPVLEGDGRPRAARPRPHAAGLQHYARDAAATGIWNPRAARAA